MCFHSVCGRRSASLGESCVGVGAAILPVLSVNTSDCYGWGNSCDTSWNSGRLENISHSWENAARYCNSLMSPSCSAPPQLKLIWQIKMWKNSNRGSSTHFSLISDKFRLGCSKFLFSFIFLVRVWRMVTIDQLVQIYTVLGSIVGQPPPGPPTSCVFWYFYS